MLLLPMAPDAAVVVLGRLMAKLPMERRRVRRPWKPCNKKRKAVKESQLGGDR